MANAANTRNIRNSKSRQYAQDRKRFGGSSASESAPKKESSNYLDKSLRSSADTSGQPRSSTIDTKGSSGSSPNSKNYSKNLTRIPSVDKSSEPASKATPKSQYGLKEASPRANAVTARAGNIGAAAKNAARTLSRGLGAASLALEPGNLSGDETPYSKKAYTQPKPDAPYSVTSAKDRAAELLGNPKVSTPKTESASKVETSSNSAPKATVKKTAVVAVKPSKTAPKESDSSRASRMAAYENWVKTNRDPMTSEYLGTEEDVNTPGKLEATENMKKGGMTKRPPKPTKKAPARRFASGGSTGRSSASKRGDGCATKGHTKGKYC